MLGSYKCDSYCLCSSNQLLSGKKSTKNGLFLSCSASNSGQTPLKPIPKEHFIQYPSCEWKHSFPQNATTELPALQIHHAWLHPTADCMRCCSCSGIRPITCQIKMSNGYSHQLWAKTFFSRRRYPKTKVWLELNALVSGWCTCLFAAEKCHLISSSDLSWVTTVRTDKKVKVTGYPACHVALPECGNIVPMSVVLKNCVIKTFFLNLVFGSSI